jgi:hypothetical protein
METLVIYVLLRENEMSRFLFQPPLENILCLEYKSNTLEFWESLTPYRIGQEEEVYICETLSKGGTLKELNTEIEEMERFAKFYLIIDGREDIGGGTPKVFQKKVRFTQNGARLPLQHV